MKRLSIVGLMLASAFALTNCSQEIVPPIQENDVIVDESIKEDTTPEEVVSIPFEVYANPSAETRTAHDSENNGTKWSANDTINVYHSVHNRNSYKNNHAFIIADVEKGLFGGGLAEPLASGTYDWCFLYPYDKSRGNTTTTTVQIGATKGTDGAYVQRLTNGAGSKEHIAGNLFPMYGHASGISADQNPKVQMRHMSAIVALKIVNQGDSKKENLEQEKNDSDKSKIVINDITFAVPAYSTSAISQKAIPIVGSFNVDPTNDINSASFTPVTDASSNSVKLEFASTEIDPGESATFYLAVRPFDVSNSVLGGSEKRTGLTLSITINGSTRSVEIPAGTQFEAGKVTTLRVPVKLSHPKISDALSTKENVGYEFISWSNKKDQPINVNGESVNAYVVGDGGQGTITITGEIDDLVNALPASFYVSYWTGKPAAMTVTNINAWIKEGDEYIPIADYDALNSAIRSELKGENDKVIYDGIFNDYDLTETAVGLVTSFLKSGIPREDDLFGLCLTKFIDPKTITFRGILSNNSNVGENILILDEEPIHKIVGDDNINSLFNQKFKGATFQGLVDIINGNSDSPAALTTSEILYDTINKQFSKDANGKDRVITIKKEVNIFIGKFLIDADVRFKAVLDAFFKDAEGLRELLPKLKLSITIGTYPYSSIDADYGAKGAPKTPNKPYNPLVFWGLDAYGN